MNLIIASRGIELCLKKVFPNTIWEFIGGSLCGNHPHGADQILKTSTPGIRAIRALKTAPNSLDSAAYGDRKRFAGSEQ
jgi:hypothetical protein